MPIDGYFLERMVLELKPKIVNAKLRKIKSPSKTSFLFEFYQLGQSYYLLLDLNLSSPNLRLTNDLVDSETSNFVIHLKKHLLNAQLNDITQYKKDRILKFSFTVVDTFLGFVNRSLIFEVMGKSSNLILLDENDIIIDSYNKHFNETKRSILPKLKYEVFPQDKKDFIFNDLAYLSSPEDLFKNYMGFSKDLSNYIFNHKINIDQEPTNPTIYISNRNVFHAIDLKLTGDKKQFNTLSELLNYYYAIEPAIQNYLLEISNKEVKKLESKKQKLSEDYQINQDYDQYRVLADEIYASGFDLKSHYSSFKGYELDYSMTLNENVQKLYSKYTKQKKSLDHLTKQIEITNNFLRYFEDIIANFDNLGKKDLDDLEIEFEQFNLIKKEKVKKKKPSTLTTYEAKNGTIYVGKSSLQNEQITHRIAKPNDLWFHVKDAPGAHVVLKGEVNQENIRKSAELAALNSPLKHSSNIPVDYTQIKFIKKIKGHPGYYVTYSHQKTIYINV